MRGPLPGTKVRVQAVRGGSPLAGIGARGRREARGAGVLTERSAAERASTRRPEESLSAWSQEPARTRGATGASAPQRPSRGHRRGEGSPALATALPRTGVQRPDPEVERSGTRGRVGTGSGCGNGLGIGVAPITYIHIFHYPHNTSVLPPLTSSGGKDASVCGRARARGISNFRGSRKSKTVMLFTE